MGKRRFINDSIDYILQHLDGNLSVKDVADHFNYSEFYFSRAFKAATGESVYAFIKRLKMDQSAIDLKLERHKSITDIGLDYGYSSSNYSSAFRKHHQRSPVEFRKSTRETVTANPFHPEKLESFMTFEEYASKISIQILDETTVLYERFIGNYEELKEKWFQFMETYKDFINTETRMIERFFDDPAIASPTCCLCDLCITAEENCNLENITKIKGGRFAVYRFEGEIKDIFCTLQGVFRVWLPHSGYEMSERYGLNIYRAMDRTHGRVVMDLCIPIQ